MEPPPSQQLQQQAQQLQQPQQRAVKKHVPPSYPPPPPPVLAVPQAQKARPKQPSILTPSEREIAYRKAVRMEVVDMDVVRSLAFYGIPDTPDLRPIFWKLLLGYLPPETAAWEKHLAAKRACYQQIKQYTTRLDAPRPMPEKGALDDYTMPGVEEAQEPAPEKEQSAEQKQETAQTPPATTTPQTTTEAAGSSEKAVSKEKAWREYYQYDESLSVIEKDVARTQPSLHFFVGTDACSQAHCDALCSILFVYSRTNSAIKYVQGMNEVLAPLYYVFANDPSDASSLFSTTHQQP